MDDDGTSAVSSDIARGFRVDGERPLRVGLIYNLQRVSGEVDDREAEFDSEETVATIAEAIGSWGYEVERLEAKARMVERLLEEPPDLVFNIAEGRVATRGREAHVPAILEFLGIPYVASDAATMVVTLDKGLAKQTVAAEGIATPEGRVVRGGGRLQMGLRPDELEYPVVVKPLAEGSSKGIDAGCLVESADGLEACLERVVGRYPAGAIVERYLPGREFTVGVLEDESGLHVLPPLEIVFEDSDGGPTLYSYDVKQETATAGGVRFEAPAQVDRRLERALKRVAAGAFRALGCRDVARIDLRLDEQREPNFLECNPLPGLVPGFSDLPVAAEAVGLSYRELIGRILSPAVERLRACEACRPDRATESTANGSLRAGE